MKESLGRMHPYENRKLFIFIVFGLIFCAYKVNGQSSPNPTPTNFIPRLANYPTPDWSHRKRGLDYEPIKVLVILKNGISLTEQKRVEKEMSLFGEVRNPSKFLKIKKSSKPRKHPRHGLDLYVIKITNGMSEKEVIETLTADPAVEAADVNSIYHVK